MKHILFETITGKICIGKVDVEDISKVEPTTEIKDCLIVQVMPTQQGMELKFFPYFFPFVNEMESFFVGDVYKSIEAPQKLVEQYIHVTTGIITNVGNEIPKKIIV